jgi:hypothetical protein
MVPDGLPLTSLRYYLRASAWPAWRGVAELDGRGALPVSMFLMGSISGGSWRTLFGSSRRMSAFEPELLRPSFRLNWRGRAQGAAPLGYKPSWKPIRHTVPRQRPLEPQWIAIMRRANSVATIRPLSRFTRQYLADTRVPPFSAGIAVHAPTRHLYPGRRYRKMFQICKRPDWQA